METKNSLIDQLKAGIWDLHEGIINGEKQKPSDEENIMKGTLPKYKYINNLKQRYLMQKHLEKVIKKHLSSPFLSMVITEEQFHGDKVAEDLRFFGGDPAVVTSLPKTDKANRYFDEVAEKDERLLLAVQYVLEGSNNGGFYIGKAVQRAYGLEGTDGIRHLQPYGPAVHEKWAAFSKAFNSLSIDEELMKALVDVGRKTFYYMDAITGESYRQKEDVS